MVKINKLYHISDIHIRRYDRHNEYQVVFNNLYVYLKKVCYNNSLIVITGDLLHNKDNLTPDCIVMAYNFLTCLSKIRPVILIPGNHDFVETNTHIKDSIGAILSDHDIPNLYYLRDSGFYRYCNIVFGVVSIFDKIDIDVINYNKNGDDIMIGLYHGPVGATETAVGIILQGDKKPSDFKGFDYVLLGDIHKYQHMAFPEGKNMAYASSLISQNFSETDELHGVLVWDIVNNNTDYIVIDNPYRYIKFDIDNNKIEIDINTYIFPSNARIRLNITDTTVNDCNVIKKTIRKRYPNIVFYDNIITDDIDSSTIMSKVDYIQMLDKFIDNLNSSEKAECIKMFQTKINEINLNVDKLCFQWELLDLKFSNMFAYGMNNIIDFTKLPFNEIVGLFAPNSHGKSSLIDVILLSLYDNFSRNIDSRYRSIPSYIVNNTASTFEMIIRFKLGSDIYTIDKRGKVIGKNTSKTGKRIDFTNYTFIKNSNGVDINLTRKDRFETQKEIDNIIGTYDDFCLTTLFLQNREKNFYDMSPMERKTFLYKILCLDKFEIIFNYFKDMEKQYNIKKKDLEGQLKDIDIDTITNNISNYNHNIRKYIKAINSINNIKSIYNNKRRKYMKKLNNHNINDININYTPDHIPMLNEMIDMIDIIINTNIIIHDVTIQDFVMSMHYNKPCNIPRELIGKKIIVNDIDMAITEMEKLSGLEKTANEFIINWEEYKKKTEIIKNNNYKIKLLEEQINNNIININCDICLRRKSNYDKLVADRDHLIKLNNSIILPSIHDYDYMVDKCTKYYYYHMYINSYYNDFIMNIKTHYKNIHKFKNMDVSKLIIMKNKLLINIQYIENNKVLRKINTIEIKLERIENKLTIYNKELNNLNYMLAIADTQMSNYNTMNNNVINYTTKHNVFNALKKATHINGIPSIIISSRLNDITTKVNSMIAPFISKSINVILDGSNILVNVLDNMKHIINILGGMEMFMINIAFKIALANVSILPKTKMLIIDEGVSVLDKSHIDKFNNIAAFLNSNYNHVILISHIDGLKDHIMQFINISKIDGKSMVRYL